MNHKMLITKQGKTFFVKDTDKDYHSQYGYITAQAMKKAEDGNILKTNKGKEMMIFSPGFIDLYKKMRRGAQIIPRKDIGSIITETGITKESVVLEAGAGSGAVTCMLAALCRRVISYEKREDFFAMVKKNIAMLDLKNVNLKNQDIYEGISEKEIDVIILDLPEPWKVIPHAAKPLRPGGFLVSYSPCVPQMADFVNSLGDHFIHLKSVEILERSWEVKKRRVRPKSIGIGHSGFVSFARVWK